jgi:hypothetical protein
VLVRSCGSRGGGDFMMVTDEISVNIICNDARMSEGTASWWWQWVSGLVRSCAYRAGAVLMVIIVLMTITLMHR